MSKSYNVKPTRHQHSLVNCSIYPSDFWDNVIDIKHGATATTQTKF